MAEVVAVGPGIVPGTLHTGPLHGVTRGEHDHLVDIHPANIVDHVIELKYRRSKAYLSGDLKVLNIVEKLPPENTDPSIRQKHKAIGDRAPPDFSEGNQDRPYKSVLSPCEIQTIDKFKRISREGAGPPTKELSTESTPGSGSGTSPKKGNLGLPDNFWDDWTSDVDENGEPLDKYGNPFFEPYDPQGIVKAILKDPSFP